MLGPQCCDNPPTLSSSSGGGSVVELGGLNTYVTGSPDSKLGILLVHDAFGYESPNLRNLADKVAAAGFYVVVPDFFHGEPYNPNVVGADWFKDHGPDKAFEDSKPLIAALRSEGICAIGAAGFCWGAKVVVELAKSEYIQSAVLLHPTFVTLEDIKEVKVPIAVLGAENDQWTPPERVKQFEDVLLSKSEVKFRVKIFPGVAHGWSVRYKVDDEEAVKCAEESHRDMLDWLVEYVK